MGIEQLDKQDWVVTKVLARQAECQGDRPFFQIQDEPPVTYAQADAAGNRVANGLAALGVAFGDKVGVMLPNIATYNFCWFGISRLGAVHVAINTAYRGIFLEHVLNNAQTRFVILHKDYLERLEEIEDAVPGVELALVVGGDEGAWPQMKRIRVQPFEPVLDASAEPVAVEVRYHDIGCIMYTSGTTGPSKGVLMPHAHLYMFGLGTAENFQMTPDDVYYISMPMFHANAKLMQFCGTLVAGAKAVIVPVFSASRWVEDVRKYGATITNTLGVMTEFVYNQPPKPEDADHKLKRVVAIPAPADIAEPFRERFGVRLIEAYGMTEINIPVYTPLEGPYKQGSCGKVYDKYFEVRVVHPETDELLPPGEQGEIVARPKEPWAFMQGYNAMDDKTVEAWRNFWFHTGDAGYMDEDGYFFFQDRIKDRIRRRGENISSYEIEKVLGEHEAVAEAAAIAVTSEIAGREDEIKACIVLREDARGDNAPKPETLLDYCQGRMPYFAIPRYIEFLDALPKTPTEKVQKAKLREAGLTPNTWDRESVGYQVKR